MTKFLMVSGLLVISTLATACSDNRKQIENQDQVKTSQSAEPKDLAQEQQKAEASNKGNILDDYDPTLEQKTQKKSGNILDGYNPDSE